MNSVISIPIAHVWKPLFLEHVSKEGKLFETKQSLKDYCKKEHIASNALM